MLCRSETVSLTDLLTRYVESLNCLEPKILTVGTLAEFLREDAETYYADDAYTVKAVNHYISERLEN